MRCNVVDPAYPGAPSARHRSPVGGCRAAPLFRSQDRPCNDPREPHRRPRGDPCATRARARYRVLQVTLLLIATSTTGERVSDTGP